MELFGKEAKDKITELTKIKVDSTAWKIYYVDADGGKWMEDRPNSEYHGGGERRLQKIESFRGKRRTSRSRLD